VLILAVSKIINPTSLKNVQHLPGDSYLPEMLEIREGLTSQRISEYLRRLGKRELELSRFCASLVKEDEEALVYDITSISSYSKLLGWLEYGKDYCESGLPQANLELVISMERRPLNHFERFVYGMTNFFEVSVEDHAPHLKRRPKAVSQHLSRVRGHPDLLQADALGRGAFPVLGAGFRVEPILRPQERPGNPSVAGALLRIAPRSSRGLLRGDATTVSAAIDRQ